MDDEVPWQGLGHPSFAEQLAANTKAGEAGMYVDPPRWGGGGVGCKASFSA